MFKLVWQVYLAKQAWTWLRFFFATGPLWSCWCSWWSCYPLCSALSYLMYCFPRFGPLPQEIINFWSGYVNLSRKLEGAYVKWILVLCVTKIFISYSLCQVLIIQKMDDLYHNFSLVNHSVFKMAVFKACYDRILFSIRKRSTFSMTVHVKIENPSFLVTLSLWHLQTKLSCFPEYTLILRCGELESSKTVF